MLIPSYLRSIRALQIGDITTINILYLTSRLYVAVHLFSYGSQMALKCGAAECVTDVSNNAIRTRQANKLQILLPSFLRPSITFRAFPLDKDIE